ncbi:MAG TPA: hypothetical protein ENN73_06385, partial [Firmicutes bacterium]|nr:hypothetical protein [Bacillota bacterium]
MEHNYTITFMGKGNNSTFLNLQRQVKNEGFEIKVSEFQLSDDAIAGYFLVPGKPNDTSRILEERLK